MGSENQIGAADADDPLSDEEWNRLQDTQYNRDRARRGRFISDTNHRPEPTGEYFRWYEHGGNPRLEPLTREELIDYYGSESSYLDSLDRRHDVAFTEADWAAYKTQFLGNLKAPLALLQRIVSEEEGHWRDSIYPIADWCRTTQEPHPKAVYRAISEPALYTQRLRLWISRAIKPSRLGFKNDYLNSISTRRLARRPARVALEATYSPTRPSVLILLSSIC